MGIRIVALENGPYQVETGGSYSVDDERREDAAIYLCRCGQSSSKPFCDGTHKKVGFSEPSREIELGA